MIKKIFNLINNSPAYNILRYSFLPEFFIETFFHKTLKSEKFYESFLYVKEIAAPKLAYDIGANKGNKVKALVNLGFKVIALEPEKKSLSTLHYRFNNNKSVTIIEKGVSDKEGASTIYITEARSGLNTMSDKWKNSLTNPESNRWGKKVDFNESYTIELTTLENLIQEYGVPCFIKIDVEGYEDKVIKGLKSKPQFISFETNLPEFYKETVECITHLRNLSDTAVFNYSIMDKLESDSWISYDNFKQYLNTTSNRYLEIICKM